MVGVIVFGIHVAAAGYAFFSRRKTAGTSEGLLAVAFIAIIFSVGWTITTMLVNLVMTPEGFAEWLDRDAITLVLLTGAEAVFYYFFLKSGNKEG